VVLAREISGARGRQSAEGGGLDPNERRDLSEPASFWPQEPIAATQCGDRRLDEGAPCAGH